MSKTVTELVDACDKILYGRMEKHVISDALLLATTVISASHGQILVQEASRQSGYSERQEFKNWIFDDPERRERLCSTYNRLFNSTRVRQ